MATPTGDRADAHSPGRIYRDLSAHEHPDCIACSPTNAIGLHLSYTCCDDGSVEARFDCKRCYAGYSGLLHGGVVALLLDSAMTHCLFANQGSGYTAELTVRYHVPVTIENTAVIRARIVHHAHNLYRLHAELVQDNTVRASGRATFVARPSSDSHNTSSTGAGYDQGTTPCAD